MKRLFIYFSLVALMFFIGCDKKSNQSEPPQPKNKTPVKSLLLDAKGNPVPLPKDKLIFVNFMAYSCSACMEEIPIIKKVMSLPEYKDKFAVIAFAIDATDNNLKDKDFPIYANNNLNQVRFPVPGTPTSYIITPNGKKLVVIVGAVREDTLKKFLNEALQKYNQIKKP